MAGFLVVTVGAGMAAGLATTSGVMDWYPTLEKPAFNPPSWVFGPVWTLLYIGMAVAAWRVWLRLGFDVGRREMSLYGIQLALNVAWSFLFFGLESPLWALVEILLLLGAIVWTQRAFARVDRVAGWLFLPYLAWVSFATVLNATIWWLNRAPG